MTDKTAITEARETRDAAIERWAEAVCSGGASQADLAAVNASMADFAAVVPYATDKASADVYDGFIDHEAGRKPNGKLRTGW